MSLNLTKRDLEEWNKLNRRINEDIKEYKELVENVTSVSSVDLRNECRSKNHNDRIGEIVVNFIVYAEFLLKRISDNLKKIIHIKKEVCKIENLDIQSALTLHYRNGLSWSRVAKELGKKESTVRMACKNFCY